MCCFIGCNKFCKINVLKSLCRIINWNCCNAERKINSCNFIWQSFNLTLQQNLNLTNQCLLLYIVKFRKIAIVDKRWVTTLYSRYKWKWMPIHFNIRKRKDRLKWDFFVWLAKSIRLKVTQMYWCINFSIK